LFIEERNIAMNILTSMSNFNCNSQLFESQYPMQQQQMLSQPK